MNKTSNHLPGDLQEIINGCIQKERSAQVRLYRMYCTRMMGVCLWYAKNKQEAEEILQDGFVRVFAYAHTYKGEGSLEGWIRKIMVNTALQKFRNKKMEYMRIVDYSAEIHDSAVQASFVSNFDEKELLKLIQTLTPMYRMVFNLFVMEGMKHREISEMLEISEGTSKSNLADARAILQKKINKLQKTAAS